MQAGDEVYIVYRNGSRVPGRVIAFSFTGPFDGEPYYEVVYSTGRDHFPISRLITVE